VRVCPAFGRGLLFLSVLFAVWSFWKKGSFVVRSRKKVRIFL